ncbi:MAG: GDSL-type esterase/lipase family protein [Armatimonadota bacterium]
MMPNFYRIHRRAPFLIAAMLLLLQGCGGGGGNVISNPILIVTDLTWSPANPRAGEEVTFSAVVKNIGTAATPNGTAITINFCMDGTDICWSNTYHASLPTNETVTLSSTGGPAQKATWTAAAGTFQVATLVDKSQLIQPISTPNNSLVKDLIVDEPPPPPPPPVVKIMPLGDSITVGVGSDTSYRYYLWKRLRQAGYDNINFVGSRHGIYGHPPLDDDWDQDHQAICGWKTDDFLGTHPEVGQLGGEQGWAALYQPDIVLILLGSNDLGCGRTSQEALDNLGIIIDIFRGVKPNVCIALALLPPARCDYDAILGLTDEDRDYLMLLNDSIGTYNEQIPLLAQTKSMPASPVIAVDLYSVLDPLRDVPDGVHPTNEANAVLADAWYPAVSALLGNRSRRARGRQ